MKRIGLFAFGLTTCVLVPTTLHMLVAGPNQVAKLYAPDQTSIDVNGAKVDISVDRGLVDVGGKVHVTLTATADKRTKVPLAVLVYEQAGMGEARTENPPTRVGRDEVTLDVADGKASKTFAFTLRGFRASGMSGTDAFGHYTVLVMSPKAADLLEAKRRHTTSSDRDPDGFFMVWYGLNGGAVDPDSDVGKFGEIARVDVATRTDSESVKILGGDIAQAGDIAVKVRVHNPTRRAFANVGVTLATQPERLRGTWLGIKPDDVVIDDNPDATFALKPHETKDVVFHVHTSATGTLGLFASVNCAGEDCWNGAESARQLDDSVLDAIDIVPATAPEHAGSAVATADGSAAAGKGDKAVVQCRARSSARVAASRPVSRSAPCSRSRSAR